MPHTSTMVSAPSSQRLAVVSCSTDFSRNPRSHARAVDPELTYEQVKNLYWGSQYDRLAELKSEYDPRRLLSSPQGIRPRRSTARFLLES